MASKHWPRSTRPVIMGTHHMVSAGHYLAAAAGFRILEAGGNAIDAGVATGLCINVTQADLTNIGGVAPIMLYRADSGALETISGLGWWPKAASIEFFHREQGGRIGRGIYRCVIPSAIDAWLTALERHGTMTLAEVAAPPSSWPTTASRCTTSCRDHRLPLGAMEVMLSWPSTRGIFLPDGKPLPLGARVVQKDLAKTLRLLVEAEHGATSREAGIRAARDRFYNGDIAEQMARFPRQQGGWLTREDLAEFHVGVEKPVKTNYRGYEVYACGPWCQGPVVPETLNILEGYDLAGLDRFSRRGLSSDPRSAEGLLRRPRSVLWRPALRRCADRRPALEGVRGRAGATGSTRARPAPGCPSRATPGPSRPAGTAASRWQYPAPKEGPVEPDTSYVAVVDRWGNAFSATPSDGATSTPLVDGLGLIISSRGMQTWLDPDHP